MDKPLFFEAERLTQLTHIRHGFFGRKGGVSEGLYDSLNVGLGSNDRKEAVLENREICLKALGQEKASLVGVYQVHGNTVMTVTKAWNFEDNPKADALVTDQPNIMLAILTADCVPILLADQKKSIIGAAHSGWKGTQLGIGAETLKAMAALGSNPADIIAVVGPCIHQNSYEVGPEFPDHFQKGDGYFKPSKKDGHFLFDLPRYVADHLRQSGVGAVDVMDYDTYARPRDFFSYRRSTHAKEADYGRQLSTIGLNPSSTECG